MGNKKARIGSGRSAKQAVVFPVLSTLWQQPNLSQLAEVANGDRSLRRELNPPPAILLWHKMMMTRVGLPVRPNIFSDLELFAVFRQGSRIFQVVSGRVTGGHSLTRFKVSEE